MERVVRTLIFLSLDTMRSSSRLINRIIFTSFPGKFAIHQDHFDNQGAAFLFFLYILPTPRFEHIACLVDATCPPLTINPVNISSYLQDVILRLSYWLYIFLSSISIILSACWCEKSQCVLSPSNIFYLNTCAIKRCKLFPRAARASNKCRVTV